MTRHYLVAVDYSLEEHETFVLRTNLIGCVPAWHTPASLAEVDFQPARFFSAAGLFHASQESCEVSIVVREEHLCADS